MPNFYEEEQERLRRKREALNRSIERTKKVLSVPDPYSHDLNVTPTTPSKSKTQTKVTKPKKPTSSTKGERSVGGVYDMLKGKAKGYVDRFGDMVEDVKDNNGLDWGDVTDVTKYIMGNAPGAQGAFNRGFLDKDAAEKTPDFATKAGANVKAGFGDLIEGTGNALEWMGAEKQGKSIAEFGQKNFIDGFEKPYEKEFTWSSMLDPDFYSSSAARTLPFMLSMLVPGTLGFKAGSVAGSAIANATKLGNFGKTVIRTTAGAVGGTAATAPFEAAFEAGNVFKEALNRGMTEEQAHLAADDVFKKNLALLGVSNLPELAAVFMPIKGGSALVKAGKYIGSAGIAAGIEGGQEALQEGFSSIALGDSQNMKEYLKTDQWHEPFALGGLMGGSMSIMGKLGNGDPVAMIKNRTQEKMSDEVKSEADRMRESMRQEGFSEDEIEDAVLDFYTELPEGQQATQEAVQEVIQNLTRGEEENLQPASPDEILTELPEDGVDQQLRQNLHNAMLNAVDTGIQNQTGQQQPDLSHLPQFSPETMPPTVAPVGASSPEELRQDIANTVNQMVGNTKGNKLEVTLPFHPGNIPADIQKKLDQSGFFRSGNSGGNGNDKTFFMADPTPERQALVDEINNAYNKPAKQQMPEAPKEIQNGSQVQFKTQSGSVMKGEVVNSDRSSVEVQLPNGQTVKVGKAKVEVLGEATDAKAVSQKALERMVQAFDKQKGTLNPDRRNDEVGRIGSYAQKNGLALPEHIQKEYQAMLNDEEFEDTNDLTETSDEYGQEDIPEESPASEGAKMDQSMIQMVMLYEQTKGNMSNEEKRKRLDSIVDYAKKNNIAIVDELQAEIDSVNSQAPVKERYSQGDLNSILAKFNAKVALGAFNKQDLDNFKTDLLNANSNEEFSQVVEKWLPKDENPIKAAKEKNEQEERHNLIRKLAQKKPVEEQWKDRIQNHKTKELSEDAKKYLEKAGFQVGDIVRYTSDKDRSFPAIIEDAEISSLNGSIRINFPISFNGREMSDNSIWVSPDKLKKTNEADFMKYVKEQKAITDMEFKMPWEMSLKEFMADDTWKMVHSGNTKDTGGKTAWYTIMPNGEHYPGGYTGHGPNAKKAKEYVHQNQVYWQLRKDAASVSPKAVETYKDLAIDLENWMKVRKAITVVAPSKKIIIADNVENLPKSKTHEFNVEEIPHHLGALRQFVANHKLVGEERRKWKKGRWDIDEIVGTAIWQKVDEAIKKEFKEGDRILFNEDGKWTLGEIDKIFAGKLHVDAISKTGEKLSASYYVEWEDALHVEEGLKAPKIKREKRPKTEFPEGHPYKLGEKVRNTVNGATGTYIGLAASPDYISVEASSQQYWRIDQTERATEDKPAKQAKPAAPQMSEEEEAVRQILKNNPHLSVSDVQDVLIDYEISMTEHEIKEIMDSIEKPQEAPVEKEQASDNPFDNIASPNRGNILDAAQSYIEKNNFTEYSAFMNSLSPQHAGWVNDYIDRDDVRSLLEKHEEQLNGPARKAQKDAEDKAFNEKLEKDQEKSKELLDRIKQTEQKERERVSGQIKGPADSFETSEVDKRGGKKGLRLTFNGGISDATKKLMRKLGFKLNSQNDPRTWNKTINILSDVDAKLIQDQLEKDIRAYSREQKKAEKEKASRYQKGKLFYIANQISISEVRVKQVKDGQVKVAEFMLGGQPNGGSDYWVPIERADTDFYETSNEAWERVRKDANFRSKKYENVVTQAGTEVETRFAIVPLDDIIASHNMNGVKNPDYPEELQPRFRDAQDSKLQARKMALELDPERLLSNRMASDGAPILGPDMVVESGNGRMMALETIHRLADPSTAEGAPLDIKQGDYWTTINEFAKENGHLPTDDELRKIKNPVLVRIRTSPWVDRKKFVQEANESTVSSMSATETALADAKKMDKIIHLFVPSESGDVNTAQNQEFVKRYINDVVPSNERREVRTAEGYLSQDGKERLERALFALAYNDRKALEKYSEDLDDNARTVTGAMTDIAPKLAVLNADIKNGSILSEFDIAPDIVDAFNKLVELRRKGENIAKWIKADRAQTSMFEDAQLSETAYELLAQFDKVKSRKRIRAFLFNYVEYVLNDPRSQGSDLLGQTATKEEFLEIAIERADGGGDLFEIDAQTRPSQTKDDGKGTGTQEESGKSKKKVINPLPEDPEKVTDQQLKEYGSMMKKLYTEFMNRIEDGSFPTGNAVQKDIRKMAQDVIGRPPQEEEWIDALEAAVQLLYKKRVTPEMAIEKRIEIGRELEGYLKVGGRSLEQTERQQFSTPIPLAEIVRYAANPKKSDWVKEGSAGTGSLLLPLMDEVEQVQAIELSPRRAAILESMGIDVINKSTFDVSGLKATLVVGNPPFRGENKGKGSVEFTGKPPWKGGWGDYGNRFLNWDLRSLKDGDRLVYVVAGGVIDGKQNAEFRKWLKENHTVRALVKFPSGVYDTRGTKFPTGLIVVEKGKSTGYSTITGEYETLESLLDALKPLSTADVDYQKLHDERVAANKVRLPKVRAFIDQMRPLVKENGWKTAEQFLKDTDNTLADIEAMHGVESVEELETIIADLNLPFQPGDKVLYEGKEFEVKAGHAGKHFGRLQDSYELKRTVAAGVEYRGATDREISPVPALPDLNNPDYNPVPDIMDEIMSDETAKKPAPKKKAGALPDWNEYLNKNHMGQGYKNPLDYTVDEVLDMVDNWSDAYLGQSTEKHRKAYFNYASKVYNAIHKVLPGGGLIPDEILTQKARTFLEGETAEPEAPKQSQKTSNKNGMNIRWTKFRNHEEDKQTVVQWLEEARSVLGEEIFNIVEQYDVQYNENGGGSFAHKIDMEGNKFDLKMNLKFHPDNKKLFMRTLFHEFGHVAHFHVLSKAEWNQFQQDVEEYTVFEKRKDLRKVEVEAFDFSYIFNHGNAQLYYEMFAEGFNALVNSTEEQYTEIRKHVPKLLDSIEKLAGAHGFNRPTPKKQPNKYDKARDISARAADAARARLKARHKGNTTLYSGLPMDDLIDYAIIGWDKLNQKTMDMAEFTENMVKEFGESIRDWMPAIYGQSLAMTTYEPDRIEKMLQQAYNDDDMKLVEGEEVVEETKPEPSIETKLEYRDMQQKLATSGRTTAAHRVKLLEEMKEFAEANGIEFAERYQKRLEEFTVEAEQEALKKEQDRAEGKVSEATQKKRDEKMKKAFSDEIKRQRAISTFDEAVAEFERRVNSKSELHKAVRDIFEDNEMNKNVIGYPFLSKEDAYNKRIERRLSSIWQDVYTFLEEKAEGVTGANGYPVDEENQALDKSTRAKVQEDADKFLQAARDYLLRDAFEMLWESKGEVKNNEVALNESTGADKGTGNRRKNAEVEGQQASSTSGSQGSGGRTGNRGSTGTGSTGTRNESAPDSRPDAGSNGSTSRNEETADIPETVSGEIVEAGSTNTGRTRKEVGNGASDNNQSGDSRYVPGRVVTGAPHPGNVTEAPNMRFVKLPEEIFKDDKYLPHPKVIKGGKFQLSDVQIETLMAAKYNFLEHNKRGILLADDTGMGKTATQLGILADAYFSGRAKRMIVVTTKDTVAVSSFLPENYEKFGFNIPMEWIGTDSPYMKKHGNSFKDAAFNEGKEYKEFQFGDGVIVISKTTFRDSQESVIKWLNGTDGDVLIMMDESHEFANRESGLGKANIRIYNQFREKAQFVYASATAAEDVSGLEHLFGLNLWSTDGFGAFQTRLTSADTTLRSGGKRKSGMAAAFDKSGKSPFKREIPLTMMEQITRELKMEGQYIGRQLSMEGITTIGHEVKLSPKDVGDWNRAVQFVGMIAQKAEMYGRKKDGSLNPKARGMIISQVVGYMRRLSGYYRMKAIISDIQKQKDEGTFERFGIIGIFKTGDEGKPANLSAAIHAINDKDNVDTGTDVITVEIPEARDDKQELFAILQGLNPEWGENPVPDIPSPMEMLYDAFGEENVAIVSGDVKAKDRPKVVTEFQENKRNIIWFNSAGGTGVNMHDTIGIPIRVYTQDYAYNAKDQKQAEGRFHRTGQKTTPTFVYPYLNSSTDTKFVGTLLARYESMGALSRGDVGKLGGDELSNFDFTGEAAELAAYEIIPELDKQDLAEMFGGFTEDISFYSEDGALDETAAKSVYSGDSPEVKKFLNALMFLDFEASNRVFKQFTDKVEEIERRMEEAGGVKDKFETFKGKELDTQVGKNGIKLRKIQTILSKNQKKQLDFALEKAIENEEAMLEEYEEVRAKTLVKLEEEVDKIDAKQNEDKLELQEVKDRLTQHFRSMNRGEMTSDEYAKQKERSDKKIRQIELAIYNRRNRLDETRQKLKGLKDGKENIIETIPDMRRAQVRINNARLFRMGAEANIERSKEIMLVDGRIATTGLLVNIRSAIRKAAKKVYGENTPAAALTLELRGYELENGERALGAVVPKWAEGDVAEALEARMAYVGTDEDIEGIKAHLKAGNKVTLQGGFELEWQPKLQQFRILGMKVSEHRDLFKAINDGKADLGFHQTSQSFVILTDDGFKKMIERFPILAKETKAPKEPEAQKTTAGDRTIKGLNVTVETAKHTKTGEDIWLVKVLDEIPNYGEFAGHMKKFGGRYYNVKSPFANFRGKFVFQSNPEPVFDKKVEDELHDRINSRVRSGDEMGIVPNLPFMNTRRPQKDRKYAMADPEIQDRIDAADSIPQEGMAKKIKEYLGGLKNRMTREFEHLPNSGKFSEIRHKLLNLEKQRGIAMEKTARNLQALLIDLDRDQYELYKNIVLLSDLEQELDAEHALAFGFTPEKLEIELSRAEAFLAGEPKVQESLDLRTRLWDDIKRDYIKAFGKIGVNMQNKFTKDDYYRHIVIQKQVENSRNAAQLSAAKALKTPKGKGYMKKRKGSELDYVTDYLLAESEVMSNMLFDMEVANTIALVDENHNIERDIKKQVDAENMKAFNKLIAAEQKQHERSAQLKSQGLTEDEIEAQIEKEKFLPERVKQVMAFYVSEYKLRLGNKHETMIQSIEAAIRQRVGWAFSEIRSLAEDGELWEGKNGEYEYIVDLLNNDPSGISKEDMFEYLADLAGQDHDGAKWAGMYLKYNRLTPAFQKDMIGEEDYKTVLNSIPDGYSIWRPDDSNLFVRQNTLSDYLAERLFNGTLDELTEGDFSKQLVLAGKKKGYIIETELAATLDHLMDVPKFNTLKKAMQNLKQVLLIGPVNVFKYNARNMTGDLDKTISGNPHALHPVILGKAHKELNEVFFRNRAPGKEMKAWMERGGLQTLIQSQEFGEMKHLRIFKDKMMQKELSLLQKTINAPKGVWDFYWNTARKLTDHREALLRYANFLSYLEQVEKGNGKPKNYGASLRHEIDALSDKYDKAFNLSNDLLIAYDKTSAKGRELRDTWFPFWSFIEGNVRQYTRLFKNAYHDEEIAAAVGRKLIGTLAVKSPVLAYRTGKLALKVSFVTALIALYNALLWPDEEEELPEHVRKSVHIILGRNEEGDVVYFNRLGTLEDFLEWFGIDDIDHDVKAILNNEKTFPETLGMNVVKPANKLIQALNPIGKQLTEQIFGVKLFPDFMEPTRIHDRAEHLASLFTANKEYAALRDTLIDRPAKEHKFLSNWVSYSADVEETNYYAVRDMQAEAAEKYLDKKVGGIGRKQTPKTEALYEIKQGMKYGDLEYSKKWFDEYVLRGGTLRGLEQSLRSLHPLADIPKDYRDEYFDTLSEAEQEKVKQAMEYYKKVLLADTNIVE